MKTVVTKLKSVILLELVICSVCDTEQPVGRTCTNCGVNMGEYFCDICMFYDDDLEKGLFHCDDCGICRVGGPENFFHCKKCGICYSIGLRDNHSCVENSMRHHCPICYEVCYFFQIWGDNWQPYKESNACQKQFSQYTCPRCNTGYCSLPCYKHMMPTYAGMYPHGSVYPHPGVTVNERELKREKRKQSNRDSAKRSRLRKQAEAEELGKKVEYLTAENLSLKSDIKRLTVNSANLELQNAQLLEKLKKAQVEEATEGDPRPDKKGLSLSTANLLSRVDNGSGSVVEGATSSGVPLRQLLDASPMADAVVVG